MDTELLRLRCRGHGAIRATHTKTLELSYDTDITGRATCVAGVGCTTVDRPARPLAGRLRITLSVGRFSATVRALGNSAWRPEAGVVVRRSGERQPNTLATDADTAAADLPRPIVEALASPDAEITVVVERDDHERADEPGGYQLIRYRATVAEPRLEAEYRAADAVFAEDAAARRLVADLGGTAVRDLPTTGRVLAIATTDTTSPPVRAALGTRPALEVLGLPPESAVAWASPHEAPVLTLTGLPRREMLRWASRALGSMVVFRCPAGDAERWLRDAERTLGTVTGALMPTSPFSGERPLWGPLDELTAGVSTGEVVCALDPVVAGDAADLPELDPSGLVASLLAEGVTAKAVARALAAQPGWSRRRAYDLVLDVSGRSG